MVIQIKVFIPRSRPYNNIVVLDVAIVSILDCFAASSLKDRLAGVLDWLVKAAIFC